MAMDAGGARRAPKRLHVEVAGVQRVVTVEPDADGGSRFVLRWDDTSYEVDVSRVRPGTLSLVVPADGYASHEVTGHETVPGEWTVGLGGRRVRARVTDGRRRGAGATGHAEQGEHRVPAPMPGRVVRVLVEAGDVVRAGQGLAVVEAMKMENEVASPAAGLVSDVRVAAGDSVETGGVLVIVDTAEHD